MDDKNRMCSFEVSMATLSHELLVGVFTASLHYLAQGRGIAQKVRWFTMEFTRATGEVVGRLLQTRPNNKAVTLHCRSLYHSEDADCALVFTSISAAC